MLWVDMTMTCYLTDRPQQSLLEGLFIAHSLSTTHNNVCLFFLLYEPVINLNTSAVGLTNKLRF